MSDDHDAVGASLGFLLLRDGHAVPLSGISPPEIKSGAKHLVPHPDAEALRHRRTLTAIVDRLGFRGDFGNFKDTGWPAFQAFLREHGCVRRAGLFPSDHYGCIDLYLRPAFGPTRRQLADRVFEADAPAPNRVFLGHGIDWEGTWDRYRFDGRERTIASVGGDPSTAEERARALFDRRHDLAGQWGFIDDKLVWGPVQHVVDKTYWQGDTDEQDRKRNLEKVTRAVQAFRAVFDASSEGWVDLLRFNDRLVVLRGQDGSWDLLWRAYRAEEPPKPADVGRWTHLAVEDLPSSQMSKSDLYRAHHFRQRVWEEYEAHEAEQAFYDRGGSAEQRRMTSEADVRHSWLQEHGRVAAPEKLRWTGSVPPDFRVIEVPSGAVAVSDLVDLNTFRRMLTETGYLERRDPNSESWERANEAVPPHAPVGATWADAQAFCAWKERQLGVAVRLPRKDELRAMRPFHSERYAQMAGVDFPWESWPPRPIVEQLPGGGESRSPLPSAVAWSEPRFLEPTAALPEFPPDRGWGSKPRKRWIADFPPAAPWRDELPWAEHAGLKFIDAWDAYEWCQEPEQISGRYWEGAIGRDSWGAYKNVKVAFRLVLELGE